MAHSDGAMQVDTTDGHGNTLLSEAAAGGSMETCCMLLALGADPNSQGAFQRTPLWRAAFLGHTALVKKLMEHGCDPRIPNDSGELPLHTASSAAIREMITRWDVDKTEVKVTEWKSRRSAELALAAAAEKKELEVRYTSQEWMHNCEPDASCTWVYANMP